MHRETGATESTMLYRRAGYLLIVISIALLCSTGCQKSIPLDTLVAKKKSKVTKKLTMGEAIRQGELEYADNLYLDYRGENPDSEKLPPLMLKLSRAHIEHKEYLLARYYAEAYITDYPDGKRVDEAWFLRLKSLFLRFKLKGSGESLGKQFQEEATAFIADPALGKYHAKVRTLMKISKKIERQRNEALAVYYEKLGKHKAAAFYRERNRVSSEIEKKEKSKPLIYPDRPL